MTTSQSPSPTSQSPLAEASPQAMDELMSRDPLGLSDQESQFITDYYLALGAKFAKDPETPKGRAKAPRLTAAERAALPKPSSLGFDED